MLDPWYGGEEKGPLIAQKYGKDITLEIAQKLQVQLEASGFKVYLTRNGDRFVPLEDRSFQGKSKGADVHLAIKVTKAKTDCVRIYVASPSVRKPSQESQTYKRDELNEKLDEILKGLQADSIGEESLSLGGVIRDKLKIGSAFTCIELWKGKDYILKNAHLPTVIVDFRISSTIQ
jgi:N-acetylmuramoyl-L-alanine amidase